MICLMSVNTTTENQDTLLEQYLADMAGGDKTALEKLYQATSSAVFGFALSILKNPHSAEDVLQDCFVRIFHAAATYRPEGKPMAWMLTITRNLCMQALRKESVAADLPQEEWENFLGADDGGSVEERLVLKACLEQLSVDERQVLMLHAVAGYKHREIARQLDMPLSTVLSKYHRAVKKLKNHMRKELAE